MTLKTLLERKNSKQFHKRSLLQAQTSQVSEARGVHDISSGKNSLKSEETLNGLNNRELTWLDVINSRANEVAVQSRRFFGCPAASERSRVSER